VAMSVQVPTPVAAITPCSHSIVTERNLLAFQFDFHNWKIAPIDFFIMVATNPDDVAFQFGQPFLPFRPWKAQIAQIVDGIMAIN